MRVSAARLWRLVGSRCRQPLVLRLQAFTTAVGSLSRSSRYAVFSSTRNVGCLLDYRCRYCNSIRFRFREIISTTPIVNSAHRDSDPALPTPYERVEPRTSDTKSRPGSGKKRYSVLRVKYEIRSGGSPPILRSWAGFSRTSPATWDCVLGYWSWDRQLTFQSVEAQDLTEVIERLNIEDREKGIATRPGQSRNSARSPSCWSSGGCFGWRNSLGPCHDGKLIEIWNRAKW